jgi:O-antigen ligase
MAHPRSIRHTRPWPDLPQVLIITLIILLWIAGGASKADAIGQVVVRAGCWSILVTAIFTGSSPSLGRTWPPVVILSLAIALPVIQLIPLPPNLWQSLPGRQILLVPGEVPSWRPWTMTPGATRNALASLVVPAAMLLLLTQASDRAYRSLPTVLLIMVCLAVVLGLLQFSGVRFDNPLLNDTPGEVSSIFANRNHFALLVAVGCVLAPAWAFLDRDALRWRGPLASGLVVLFVLTILATGSRSGMLLGGVALALALALVARRLKNRLRKAPAWLLPVLIFTLVLVIGGFIALSFAADRASGINRLIALESGEDLRSRALPTVLSMIAAYMPFGSGFGSFDPIFRIHEPLSLLKFTYFNQAHNDYLGIALDGGVAGLALLTGGVLWWLVATVGVWRMPVNDSVFLGRLGSAVILLILVASFTDYPARTPTVMALLIIAATWLARARHGAPEVALPA